jgi:hypothetical protein
MRYTVEMASDSMVYILSSMKTGSNSQVILMLVTQEFERL